MIDFIIPSDGLDLAQTAGPVAWGKGKWPSTDWRTDTLYWCEKIESVPTLIQVVQPAPDLLRVSGFSSEIQVNAWLECRAAWIPQPTERHCDVLGRLLGTVNVAGNLTPDAHLAALAIEHGLTLCSTDGDFARFPNLRWQNPLQQSKS